MEAAETIRAFNGPDAKLARLGSYGLAARVASEATFLAVVAEFLHPVTDWPEGLTVTAIDIDTGETVAFDGTSGVPFVSAVAASCAVPAFMPMVTIGGRRYMDGGMASQTHAQLAASNDEAVVIAPLDLGALEGEVAGLSASGTRTTIVTPGPEARRVIGRTVALLDPARRARAAEAGLLDGRRVAAGGQPRRRTTTDRPETGTSAPGRNGQPWSGSESSAAVSSNSSQPASPSGSRARRSSG
jgi:predicted acylesterase/phospholipase RssA